MKGIIQIEKIIFVRFFFIVLKSNFKLNKFQYFYKKEKQSYRIKVTSPDRITLSFKSPTSQPTVIT